MNIRAHLKPASLVFLFVQTLIGGTLWSSALASQVTKRELLGHLNSVFVVNAPDPRAFRWVEGLNIATNSGLLSDSFVNNMILWQNNKVSKYIKLNIAISNDKNSVNVGIFTYSGASSPAEIRRFLERFDHLSEEKFIQDAIKAFVNPGSCNTNISGDKFKLNKAIIFIENELTKSQKLNCYVKSILKILGIFGHSNNTNSASNQNYKYTVFSALDLLTLGIFYHPKIEPGSPLNLVIKLGNLIDLPN